MLSSIPNTTSGQAQRLGLKIDPVFYVLEFQKRDVEEVARPKGRVQHSERLEPVQKRLLQRLGLLSSARVMAVFCDVLRSLSLVRLGGIFDQVFDLGFHLSPFVQERFHNHRIDDLHDLVAVGVMRAQMATLGRVQTRTGCLEWRDQYQTRCAARVRSSRSSHSRG